MGEYIVSARKYRPSAFDAVVGQEALTTTLKNAIAAGKLAHAYLFCGPRGVRPVRYQMPDMASAHMPVSLQKRSTVCIPQPMEKHVTNANRVRLSTSNVR